MKLLLLEITGADKGRAEAACLLPHIQPMVDDDPQGMIMLGKVGAALRSWLLCCGLANPSWCIATGPCWTEL
jgi:hypothetical protein